ncbi:MAG TPA: GAF domain-containing protein [Verrucomicrobiae bacterium]|nr:GAF domain-containing protein [Verrucomicrobiae bacterium]
MDSAVRLYNPPAACPPDASLLPGDTAARALDGLNAEVALLDARGHVLAINRAWREAAARTGLGAGVGTGHDYLAACDHTRGDARLDGLALAAGIRQVLAGERKHFRFEHEVPGPMRANYRFDVTAADGTGCAIVAREDITAHKRADHFLTLEYAVVRAVASAASMAAGLQAAIRVVCETLGWDCGRYFRLDAVGAVLHFEHCWGLATPAVEEFLTRSRGAAFHLNAGLQGRVCRSGQPLWVIAGTSHPDMLAPETGRDGALLFPVTCAGNTVGVLAFSGRAIAEPDERLLQALHAIGSQVGAFVERQNAIDALRRSETRYRRLTEISTDWAWEQDSEFRFTACDGILIPGCAEVLGQRLWDLPGVVPDGADWSSFRAQLVERWSFTDFEFTAFDKEGKPALLSISGEPAFDEAGGFTGYWGTGLNLTAELRDRPGHVRQRKAGR